ncbi:MAG: lysylphosphatidylglycerol synthase transmembrane domain-containing protein, partial [Acidobacteriota bacterium]
MSDRSRFAVRLAVTLGLLGVVFYRIDGGEFLRVVGSASIALLLGAALIQIGSVFLSALRWRVILKNFDVQIDYDPLARITFIGFFFNLFLPSGIGGDFFRAYYLGQRVGRGMSTTLTTTILERSAGLCALLIIGLAASALTPLKAGGVRLVFVFLIILSLFILGNLLLFHPWTHRLLTRFFSRWKRDGLEEKMNLVAKGLRRLRRNPSAVFQAVAISFLVQF